MNLAMFPVTEPQLVHVGILLLIVSMFLYVIRAVTAKTTAQTLVWHFAWATLAVSFLIFIAAIAVRSIEAQYFALSNMYESLLVLSICMMGCFLLVDRWFKLSALGWPVCLMLLTTIGYATTLPTEIAPLQAALQSYWRSIHVPVILSSYAMFALSFITSILFLIKHYFPKQNNKGGLSPAGGPDVSKHQGSGLLAMAKTLDHTDVYDEVTYRLIAIGFPLLAIGIILGGLWANEAWGNYWSWDPKESMSLVTLLAYGVYLHCRVNRSSDGLTLAWVSVIGFIMMLITYFGVNIMGIGLHSYGKIG